MKYNPDAFAFALGGSRMAALFHDNAGHPVCPTDGRTSGLREYQNRFTSASCPLLVCPSPPLVSPYNPSSLWYLCPCCLHIVPASCFPHAFLSKHKMTTHHPFLYTNTSNFLFAVRFAIGTCMLQLRISVNKNLEHVCSHTTV